MFHDKLDELKDEFDVLNDKFDWFDEMKEELKK